MRHDPPLHFAEFPRVMTPAASPKNTVNWESLVHHWGHQELGIRGISRGCGVAPSALRSRLGSGPAGHQADRHRSGALEVSGGLQPPVHPARHATSASGCVWLSRARHSRAYPLKWNNHWISVVWKPHLAHRAYQPAGVPMTADGRSNRDAAPVTSGGLASVEGLVAFGLCGFESRPRHLNAAL